MKKLAFLVLAPLVLVACGSSSTTTYPLTTGIYTPSVGTATSGAYTLAGFSSNFSNDDCRWVPSFQAAGGPFDFPWTFAADGKSGTLVFAAPGDNGLKPAGADISVSIDGNAITTTNPAVYDTVVSTTCTYTNTVRIVSGEAIGDNQVHLVAERSTVLKAGASCAGVTLLVNHLPCMSQVDFLAKK